MIRETGGELPTLEQREAEYIEWVLERMNGNRTRAAQILGDRPGVAVAEVEEVWSGGLGNALTRNSATTPSNFVEKALT